MSLAKRYHEFMQCSLCEKPIGDPYFFDAKKSWTYWNCSHCDIVFRDPQSFLNHLQEKSRYQTHNNSIEDAGYTRFLQPALLAVKKFVKPGSRGLDYGCGPGPTLSEMLRRDNYFCVDYDPFFQPQNNLLNDQYDFVTCTEVVEHFYHPAKEFGRIDRILKPQGYFVVMTDHRRDDRAFADWGYRHDPTHVCFFNENSWRFVADHWGWEMVETGPKVTVFRKQSHDN